MLTALAVTLLASSPLALAGKTYRLGSLFGDDEKFLQADSSVDYMNVDQDDGRGTGMCSCQCCEAEPVKPAIDIILAVDSSACFRDFYSSMIHWMIKLVRRISRDGEQLEFGDDHVRLSLMLFSNDIQVPIRLDAFYGLPNQEIAQSIVKKMRSISFLGEGAYINKALDRAYDELNRYSYNNQKKYVIMLTNGKSHPVVTLENIKTSVERLSSENITVIPVSVTHKCDDEYFERLCPNITVMTELRGTGWKEFYTMSDSSSSMEVINELKLSSMSSEASSCRTCNCSCELPPGQKGERGPPGKSKTGPKGSKGNDGANGPPGNPGAIGPQGGRGPAGPRGSTGRNGVNGPPGAQGPKGDIGPTGKKGPKGSTGRQGSDGKDGQEGMKGQKGLTGVNGDKGDKGTKGADGFKGDLGPSGPKGKKGEKAKGEIGPPGPPGAQGPPGTLEALKEPKCGSCGCIGASGTKGEKGDSAVDGKDGQPGPPGRQGPRGKPGFTGDKGAAGDTGFPGPAGLRGASGPEGPQGVKGSRGANGRDGKDSYEKGPIGPKGPTGDKGSSGFPGIDGQDGKDGQPGRQGPMGFPGVSPTCDFSCQEVRIEEIIRKYVTKMCGCSSECHDQEEDKEPVDLCTEAVDLTILLDGSDSVKGNFALISDAIVNFIKTLVPSSRDQPLLLNIVQFGRQPHEELSEFICSTGRSASCRPWPDVRASIDKMTQTGGVSYTWSALEFVVTNTSRTFRPSAHKVLITITDGHVNTGDPQSSSTVISDANRIFDQMIAMSVGIDIDRLVLKKLGNGDFKNYKNHQELSVHIDQVASMLCMDTTEPTPGGDDDGGDRGDSTK